MRDAIERVSLGPSHAGPRCSQLLDQRLKGATGLSSVSVGIYGRPLGERRRSYGLYARLPQGTLTAVLTARWSASDEGPDLEIVRRVLGGIRALPP